MTVNFWQRIKKQFFGLLDSDAVQISGDKQTDNKFSLLRCMPFLLIHLGCLAAFFTGVSTTAFIIAIALYCSRVFFLTAFYHRYFSHRAFKTNRFWQCVFAICGLTAIQRGPLWWAAHHRRHHQHSDQEKDAHSPVMREIWWSHFGWFTCAHNFRTHYEVIQDWTKYPELVFLNRFDWIVPIIFLGSLYFGGQWLAMAHPQLNVDGWQLLVWGGFISTVAVYHATFCVNSLCHLFGRRPFKTDDHSRNNWLVALITFGEGWHNNHHFYPASARQGFTWWQIDISYQIIRLMAFLGIIHSIKTVPEKVMKTYHQNNNNPQ